MFMLGDYLTTSESVNVAAVSHVRRVGTANARFNAVNVQSDYEDLTNATTDLMHFYRTVMVGEYIFM